MTVNIVVLGSINMDLVIQTPHHPKIGETIKGSGFHMIPGGKGANQAVAIVRNGFFPRFIGCVGSDGFGSELFELLSNEGIDTEHVRKLDQKATGVALIIVDAQSRNTIVISPGANELISPEQVDQAADDIATADLFICQLETNFEAVEKSIAIAHKHGTKIILNPAPVRELSSSLLCQVDFLIPNEIEASMLTGINVKDLDSAYEAGQHLIQKGVDHVLITLGKLGVVILTKNLRLHLVAHQVQAIDTTAAGDTFVGNFAVVLGQGRDIQQAVRHAQSAAALSVTKLGAQSSIPFSQEINSFINHSLES